jgi:hypothetical protein
LKEPWPTVLALVAPVVSVVWAVVQAAVFEKLDEWHSTREAAREASANRRGIAELKAGLAEARAEVEAMELGEARSRRENELREVADAIAGRHFVFLKQKLEEPTSTRGLRGSSRRWRSKTRSTGGSETESAVEPSSSSLPRADEQPPSGQSRRPAP